MQIESSIETSKLPNSNIRRSPGYQKLSRLVVDINKYWVGLPSKTLDFKMVSRDNNDWPVTACAPVCTPEGVAWEGDEWPRAEPACPEWLGFTSILLLPLLWSPPSSPAITHESTQMNHNHIFKTSIWKKLLITNNDIESMSKTYPFEGYLVVLFQLLLMGRKGLRSRGSKETQNKPFQSSLLMRGISEQRELFALS